MPETPAKKTATTSAKAPAGHASLAAALVAFMLEKPRVAKTQEARIPGKDGRSGYSYKYADLADVDDAATPILAKHGLAFVAIPRRTENGAYELVGTLVHTTGEKMEGPLPLHGRTAQELGSSMTYMRRYLLGAMTGIVTDEDDDGSRANAARDQAQPEGPPEGQPHQPEPATISQTRAILGSLNPEETANIQAWWNQAATQGAMPALSNWKAVTPYQVGMLTDAVSQVRETLAQPREEAPQGPQ